MENVDLIRQLAVDAALATQFTADKLPAAVALPSDVKIHSLEGFQALRSRFRGALATTSLADFAGYVAAHAETSREGFVDVEKMFATVFFNLGSAQAPGHGDWTAALALPPTAAFKAMRAIDGQKFNQKALVDWLEDWADVLVADFTEGDSTLARAIAVIRKLKISAKSESVHAVGDFNASRSALEDVEASSFDALPIGFRLQTEPYEGLSSRGFKLKLGVLTGDEKPSLVLRWQRKEAQLEEIAREFKTVLADKLGTAVPLTIGTFKPGT